MKKFLLKKFLNLEPKIDYTDKVAEVKIEDGHIIVNGRKDIVRKMKENLNPILIEEKWIPNKK